MFSHITYFKKLYYAVSILVGVILVGTIGFTVVEGYSVLEAFYMTVITVSTVGFGEVHTLSNAGRVFTAFLIITSFGTFAFALTSISRYIVEGEYKSYIKNFLVEERIKKISGHVILCGYGRNGKQTAQTLLAHNQPFVIIEDNPDVLEALRDEGILYIQGDATKEENIIKAGVDKAKALITTLPKDSDNVFVVLTARELNKQLIIISRATEGRADKKLRIAGADNVIMPEIVGGAHMASLVVTPDVIEFLDHISIQGPGNINLEEIAFNNLPEGFKYKTIGELDKEYNTGVTIIGFKTPEGKYIINPSPQLELAPRCKLFVLGTAVQIQELNSLFGVNLS